ncbi:MAG TPA: hypothetical protein VIJ96_14020 [Acidothermaceae bacterium]
MVPLGVNDNVTSGNVSEPEHRAAAVEAMPDSLVRLVMHGVALTTNLMTQRAAIRLAGLLAVTAVVAGCGSASHVKTRTTPTASPTTAPARSVAPASSAVASVAALTSDAGHGAAPTIGPASSAFITNVCSAITISDAQATVQPAIDAIGFDPNNQDPAGIFTCTIDAADQAVTVTVEPEDVAMANYESDVAAENVPAVPSLPGVGDVAVWTQVANNPPDVYAHKGHVTCEVKTNDTQVLNLTYDPSVVDGGVTAASAAAYAVKLGALCTDVFAAIG